MNQGRQPRHVFRVDFVADARQLFESRCHVEGIPHSTMALTTSPNAPSIVLIIHVGQHVKGFRDTSQGREGGNSARFNTVFCFAATQRPNFGYKPCDDARYSASGIPCRAWPASSFGAMALIPDVLRILRDAQIGDRQSGTADHLLRSTWIRRYRNTSEQQGPQEHCRVARGPRHGRHAGHLAHHGGSHHRLHVHLRPGMRRSCQCRRGWRWAERQRDDHFRNGSTYFSQYFHASLCAALISARSMVLVMNSLAILAAGLP